MALCDQLSEGVSRGFRSGGGKHIGDRLPPDASWDDLVEALTPGIIVSAMEPPPPPLPRGNVALWGEEARPELGRPKHRFLDKLNRLLTAGRQAGLVMEPDPQISNAYCITDHLYFYGIYGQPTSYNSHRNLLALSGAKP
ncbi:hypothetical protein AK812_SmicGene31667 [Symbiodinium microadriaticum]|uniref:Uncharacterized protein n=1 Tax=Symbiodinium microadriaticum TaxID=2951 RepID=A0A1Q9CW53_SYMMI|nr:hypothetical protein AK812_SmicGene31667 [Symbiodinium microadriaticum]